MAATLSSLWGRAQSNKRPLPGQAGGCVDLTTEDEAGKNQTTGKAHSPGCGGNAPSDANDNTEVLQAAELVHDAKRRRRDTTAVVEQVCTKATALAMFTV